jgi:CheY-like chemotaxis protein
VVEDDPDVRNLVLAQLEGLGYATLAAANGPEALTLLQAHKNHVDLLLTDVVMPGGMTGVELVRAAKELRPGLPAILTSGYASGTITLPADEAEAPEYLPTLSKPYQQEELAQAVVQALAQ